MTAPAEPASQEVGKSRRRKEDARLVTGQTNWTDNITLPGLAHIAFVRSPHAHARITSVNVEAARQAPGVFAVFTGQDVAVEQGSLPCAWPVTPDIVIPPHPPMAVDTVRYAGEIVAAVVARDRYSAADALDLIDVTYEPLQPSLTWPPPCPMTVPRCTTPATSPTPGPSVTATSTPPSLARRS